MNMIRYFLSQRDLVHFLFLNQYSHFHIKDLKDLLFTPNQLRIGKKQITNHLIGWKNFTLNIFNVKIYFVHK